MIVNINEYKSKKNLGFELSDKRSRSSVEGGANSLSERRDAILRERAIKKIREEGKGIKW